MDTFFDNIQWSPTIGDPTFMGWFTVFAYFLCFFKCLSVIKYKDRIFVEPIARQLLLWQLIALAICFLGINKQLDLQTFFTASARYLAMEQGWYADRRAYQQGFIIGIGIVGIATIVGLFALFHKVIRINVFAITGVCLLIVFVLIRALSFHNMDSFLGSQIFGVKINWILELSGIALVYYNARNLVFKRRPIIDLNELNTTSRT